MAHHVQTVTMQEFWPIAGEFLTALWKVLGEESTVHIYGPCSPKAQKRRIKRGLRRGHKVVFASSPKRAREIGEQQARSTRKLLALLQQSNKLEEAVVARANAYLNSARNHSAWQSKPPRSYSPHFTTPSGTLEYDRYWFDRFLERELGETVEIPLEIYVLLSELFDRLCGVEVKDYRS